jgi:hypothetical protein
MLINLTQIYYMYNPLALLCRDTQKLQTAEMLYL